MGWDYSIPSHRQPNTTSRCCLLLVYVLQAWLQILEHQDNPNCRYIRTEVSPARVSRPLARHCRSQVRARYAQAVHIAPLPVSACAIRAVTCERQ
jgi:hypothetical protein